MKKQYIGITGFMSHDEVEGILSSFGSKNLETKVMIGVLASGKTIRGIPNRYPNRFPRWENIQSIFPENKNTLNLIHFSTDEKLTDKVVEELCFCDNIGGPNFNGFQLNIVWPDPAIITGWLEKRQREITESNATIVLQCGSSALDLCNNNPKELVSRLQKYKHLVDYVLLDPSGGKGIPFDPVLINSYLEELYSSNIEVGFGVAGGLSIQTLSDLLPPILKYFPDVSTDAEGKLRTPEDNLDVGLTMLYLNKTDYLLKVFKEIKNRF